MHTISPSSLKKRLDAGEDLLLLDVREQSEYDIVHLPDALLIPLSALPARLRELDMDKPIIAYCHHGMRSAHAVMFLLQQGFENVANLEGGIDAWARNVDPTLARY